MIIWGGSLIAGGAAGDGARYDPKTDTWSPVTTTGAPTGRYLHTAVWTGREMIIWGGGVPNPPGNSIPQNNGARYDPRSNTWTPLTTVGAPSARANHVAVWTGNEMLIWAGGGPSTNTGGRYSVLSDAWTAMSTINAPTGRVNPSAVWTGGEMLVWGGTDLSGRSLLGGRYSVALDQWNSMDGVGSPIPRSRQSGIWSGRHMGIWGGNTGGTGAGHTDTGGTYGDDSTPPVAGTVRDGLGPDLVVQLDTTDISANWSGFSDPESGIAKYEFAVGTSPGATDIQPFVSVGSASSATASGLSLQVGITYYVTVRGTNSEGLTITASSDGVFIGNSLTAKESCTASISTSDSAEPIFIFAMVTLLLWMTRRPLRRTIR